MFSARMLLVGLVIRGRRLGDRGTGRCAGGGGTAGREHSAGAGAEAEPARRSGGVAHTFEVAKGDHSSKIRERLETRVFRFFSDILSFE